MAQRIITLTYIDGACPPTLVDWMGCIDVADAANWLVNSGTGTAFNPSRIPLEDIQLFAADRCDSDADELPDSARIMDYQAVGLVMKHRREPFPTISARELERRLPHFSDSARADLLA